MSELAAAAIDELAQITNDDAEDGDLPMTRLAGALSLAADEVELVWNIVACSVDGRLVPHLEALGGAHARRGLSPAVYALLASLEDDSVARLAHWLSSPNALVETGLHKRTSLRCARDE